MITGARAISVSISFPRSPSRSYFATKTLTRRILYRRDGVHDASGEERLGYLQLPAVAADVRVGREDRRSGAEGVGVAVGGAGLRERDPRRAEPAPQRAGHALAVVLPGAAFEGLAARRRPQELG